MKLIPGYNFINVLQAAFMRTGHENTGHENAKNTVKSSVFFALLGSVHTKAACKMLIKLTTGENFNTILLVAFLPQCQFQQHFTRAFFI